MQQRRIIIAVAGLFPFAVGAFLAQVALVVAGVSVGQLLLAAEGRSVARLDLGVRQLSWASTLLAEMADSRLGSIARTNPLLLVSSQDIDVLLRVLAPAARAGAAATDLASNSTGADGGAPLVQGLHVRTEQIPALVAPARRLSEELAQTSAALGDASHGMPFGHILRQGGGERIATLNSLVGLSRAISQAMPSLANALGADKPRRYLICALNDAELFGSGGAPLTAYVVEADEGALRVVLAGPLNTELSVGNPPLKWDHSGGPPWYREGRKYPFVNSDFHPDFRTASIDMRRAWAALGYPEVDGVITIDMAAIASILRHIGPVRTAAFGSISADTLVEKVLVQAYRDFDSNAGVRERHSSNAELASSLVAAFSRPGNMGGTLRGIVEAIPGRHIQVAFTTPALQSVADSLGAQGALSQAPGDLISEFSQSAPNKLSVFQVRAIHQDVALDSHGGAKVIRTTTFMNATPEGLSGDPTTWAGYTALRARMRVAYRIPSAALDPAIEVSEGPRDSAGLPESQAIPSANGPYPDERGGKVIWQGHETAPGATTTAVLSYRLPAGTFRPGTYIAHADPQAMVRPVSLSVRLTAPEDGFLPHDTDAGWTMDSGALIWSGTLDRPITLEVG